MPSFCISAKPRMLRYNRSVLPRNLRPMRLSRRAEPFDSDHHIFELKIDGFRALAHLDAGKGELISRNGNLFHRFADLATWLAKHLRVESAVLDGEIACVDGDGRPVFRDLLFRRRHCIRSAISQRARLAGVISA